MGFLQNTPDFFVSWPLAAERIVHPRFSSIGHKQLVLKLLKATVGVCGLVVKHSAWVKSSICPQGS